MRISQKINPEIFPREQWTGGGHGIVALEVPNNDMKIIVSYGTSTKTNGKILLSNHKTVKSLLTRESVCILNKAQLISELDQSTSKVYILPWDQEFFTA